ncbi:MAG: hypothetical protein WD926_00595 [Patescibacteria group bacterium]
MAKRTPPFEAFLEPPLSDGDDWRISQGWYYEPELFGLRDHGGIDFEAERGTEVRAAADGYAVATYEEYLWQEKGKPVNRIDGEPTYFGSGLVVQIWHRPGRYTQYGHLHTYGEHIPFFEPRADKQFVHPEKLRVPVAGYPRIAHKVETGEPIGTVGMTGMGKGRRTYEDWQAGREYTQYAPDHLHFVVCGRRAPRTRKAVAYDPFGVYGKAEEYPGRTEAWPTLTGSLWR